MISTALLWRIGLDFLLEVLIDMSRGHFSSVIAGGKPKGPWLGKNESF